MKILLLILSLVLISCGKHEKETLFEKDSDGAKYWQLRAETECVKAFDAKLASQSSIGSFLSEDSIGLQINHLLQSNDNSIASDLVMTVVGVGDDSVDVLLETNFPAFCAAKGCRATLTRSDLTGINTDISQKYCKANKIINLSSNSLVSTLISGKGSSKSTMSYTVSYNQELRGQPLFVQELLSKTISEKIGEDTIKWVNKSTTEKLSEDKTLIAKQYFDEAKEVTILPYNGTVISDQEYYFLWRIIEQ